jgi:hypothetical protein
VKDSAAGCSVRVAEGLGQVDALERSCQPMRVRMISPV